MSLTGRVKNLEAQAVVAQRAWLESLPLEVLEALAAGIPMAHEAIICAMTDQELDTLLKLPDRELGTFLSRMMEKYS